MYIIYIMYNIYIYIWSPLNLQKTRSGCGKLSIHHPQGVTRKYVPEVGKKTHGSGSKIRGEVAKCCKMLHIQCSSMYLSRCFFPVPIKLGVHFASLLDLWRIWSERTWPVLTMVNRKLHRKLQRFWGTSSFRMDSKMYLGLGKSQMSIERKTPVGCEKCRDCTEL